MAQLIARVHLGPWEARAPSRSVRDGVLRELARGREVVAEVDTAGHWRAQPAAVAELLEREFGPGYDPTEAYSPTGAAAAAARDVAAEFGGRYEYLGEDDAEPAPEDAVY